MHIKPIKSLVFGVTGVDRQSDRDRSNPGPLYFGAGLLTYGRILLG